MQYIFFCFFLLFFHVYGYEKILIELQIFSGMENPKWILDNDLNSLLEQKISQSNFYYHPNTYVMGYKGFLISYLKNLDNDIPFPLPNSSYPRQTQWIEAGTNPALEMWILTTNNINITSNLLNHIEKRINEIISIPETTECASIHIPCDNTTPCCQHYVCTSDINSINPVCLHWSVEPIKYIDDCDNVPIIGPDSPPVFDPEKDDKGCFKTEQSQNNCYNYGCDIVTNSFAQPGRGSSHKWKANTCEEMNKAALLDGLIYVGSSLPTPFPSSGHYVALFIWPDTNFHWIRGDKNHFWSHKPGGTPVINTDNRGLPINDPRESDFSPWTRFCAFYQIVPSKVIIN